MYTRGHKNRNLFFFFFCIPWNESFLAYIFAVYKDIFYFYLFIYFFCIFFFLMYSLHKFYLRLQERKKFGKSIFVFSLASGCWNFFFLLCCLPSSSVLFFIPYSCTFACFFAYILVVIELSTRIWVCHCILSFFPFFLLFLFLFFSVFPFVCFISALSMQQQQLQQQEQALPHKLWLESLMLQHFVYGQHCSNACCPLSPSRSLSVCVGIAVSAASCMLVTFCLALFLLLLPLSHSFFHSLLGLLFCMCACTFVTHNLAADLHAELCVGSATACVSVCA